MKVLLDRLEVVTRQTTERIPFSEVSFLHGPVGTGKSTVARLIDFCFGGKLVETPALQSEFISSRLFARIGRHEVVLERDRSSDNVVRVTWQIATATAPDSVASVQPQSVLAPIHGEKNVPILPGLDGVESLSDLVSRRTNSLSI